MNIGIIFAGGRGSRMGKTDKPKQFLEIYDKPIIIHTIEKFENNASIDAIIVSTLEEWIDYLYDLIEKYKIKKVVKIVSGGETGQMSIFNALDYAYNNFPKDSIVLIHDGVRPFIDDKLINENILCVKKYGTAISSVYSTETIVELTEDNVIKNIPNRSNCIVAKAPQSFYLEEIYNVHLLAQKDKYINSVDSCSLMYKYKNLCHIVFTTYDNIKITTYKDIELAKEIYNKIKNY